jgi:hypothetical protein
MGWVPAQRGPVSRFRLVVSVSPLWRATLGIAGASLSMRTIVYHSLHDINPEMVVRDADQISCVPRVLWSDQMRDEVD